MSHFVKLDFELVDLLQDGPEPGDFGVGDGHGVAGAVILRLCADLSLLRQLERGDERQRQATTLLRSSTTVETYRFHPALDGLHQPVEVIAERLQAARIQQQSAVTRGGARGAGRAAPPSGAASPGAAGGLGESDLLVLAQDLDFVGGETELGVRDGLRGGHGGLWELGDMCIQAILRGPRCAHGGVEGSAERW